MYISVRMTMEQDGGVVVTRNNGLVIGTLAANQQRERCQATVDAGMVALLILVVEPDWRKGVG